MLSINQLCKSYHYADVTQTVLDGLDFEMQASTSVALLGESGSGKSTRWTAPTPARSASAGTRCMPKANPRWRRCAAPSSASFFSSFT